MSVQNWVVTGLVLLGSAIGSDAFAQDKAVGFKVRGGLVNGISYLNDAHTADLQKTGWNAGAGIQLDVSRFVAVRGDVDLNRNELSVNDVETGRDLSRVFYDASVQFTYPISNFKPYLFVGAGAVTLHAVGADADDKTTFAGTGGLGVTYNVPGTQLGLGIEGKSWLYQFEGVGGQFSNYDKLQYDATWNATLSYRIPFGNTIRAATR